MTDEEIFSGYIGKEQLLTIDQIVNRRKLSRQFPALCKIDTNEDALLAETLDTIEYAAINLWNPDKEASEKFRQICNKFVEIAQNVPLPEEELEKVRQLLRMIAYGYLGDAWETVRRYLMDKESKLIVDCELGSWNEKLLKTIYMSIFYLIRRKSWHDLGKAAELINRLRQDQAAFEKQYLDKDKENAPSKALELASLYHLAKSVELVGNFQLQGQPADIIERLVFHFDHAIQYAESGNIIELNLILRMLKPTFNKMISNSIWAVANIVNSRVKDFVDLLIKSSPPIIEFMRPQRYSILEQGLLDPAHRAIVISLPTSSGKTLIAEFRILQALNLFSQENAWIAYVVPTRALVNQITLRLRKDLGQPPLNLKVEKMSGALEIDAYEYELVTSKNDFNILVTTPEKLSLLIRQNVEESLKRPLVLVVVDEAHNIGSIERGVNLEALLSIIKKDCPRANFLLMTPFIPNPEDLGKWLDPGNYKSISVGVHFWKPNDMVIGMFYGLSKDAAVTTYFKPLITSNETMVIDDQIIVKEEQRSKLSATDLNMKYKLTALVASQLRHHESILILARSKRDTYKIANLLYDEINEEEPADEKIQLVKNFVAAELGKQFPLVRYLDKRIGIHHAGLPDDIRSLMEQLMEAKLLKYLVATTTIAQGINFDISTILMAAYSYPRKHMPSSDFWNLVGRAGRVYSASPGTVGIAVKEGIDSQDAVKLMQYVRGGTEQVVSALVQMVNAALSRAKEIDLRALYNVPGWSMFLQYIAHMFRQAKDLGEFITETEMTLRRTYGYNQLAEEKKKSLLDSVKKYAAEQLNKGLAELSDSTGFSPETIKSITRDVRGTNLTRSDWNANSMFSSQPNSLKKLVGIMLRTPEIQRHLREIKVKGTRISHYSLARLISDWVLGKDIPEISRTYFGSDDYGNISDCVSAIYGPLVMSAAWGLSAFQRLSHDEIGYEGLTDQEKKQLANLPAMVYYGVNSDEAVLLRKANVPRTISKSLGEALLAHAGSAEGLYQKTSSDISNWLNALPETAWHRAVPANKEITGSDYKKIWQMLSGYT
jgi:replicative superfamily II helicase